MRWFSLFVVTALIFMSSSAQAQEILTEPVCFMVVNEAPHKVYGSIGTDRYTNPDGSQGRHISNFRLDAAGSMDEDEGYPSDRAEFCSYGPFYEGRKLEVVLRTLFPIFSCVTNVEQGPIVITSEPIKDNPMGGYRVSARCFE